MATQTKKTVSKGGKSAAPGKVMTAKGTGAGAAVADRSKDAAKPAAKKPAPKAVAKPGKAAKPAAKPSAKTASAKAASPDKKKPSLVKRVARSVTATATGAVELAASVVGIGEKKSNPKKS